MRHLAGEIAEEYRYKLLHPKAILWVAGAVAAGGKQLISRVHGGCLVADSKIRKRVKLNAQ
jgi:hypothetical protein